MKPIEYYIDWVRASPDRLVVVPGIHMMNDFREQGFFTDDQIIDMWSLSHYNYPEFANRTVAFFEYVTCLETVIGNRLKEIVDLENDGSPDRL